MRWSVRNRTYCLLLVLGGLFSVSTRPVAAQQAWESRGFISVNGGVQATSSDFSGSVPFTLFVEEGDFTANYQVESGPLFDVGGGVRVWRNLAVGGAVSAFSKDTAATVNANLPHPFFFNQDRRISGTAENLARREVGIHIQALWIVPVNDNLRVAVFGGPTFFNINQELVTEVEFASTYPFDEAEFTGVSTVEASESAVGVNVGVDVGYYFSRSVGVGGLVRFSRASVDLTPPSGDTVSTDAGGLQAMGGLRVRF